MNRHTENKIVLVVRRTRLDELVARFNTEAQARFYVEHSGADYSDYLQEDRVYKQAKREIESILARHGRVHVVDRQYITNFLFGPEDTVVALGQDGLVANVMKYLNGQRLLGINPDANRYEGTLLPFTVKDIDRLMPEVFRNQRPTRTVTLAEVRLNTGQSILGVNDIFIGPRTHASARYSLQYGGREEQHSSSGIIVSTGLGASGWFKSILAGVTSIASALSAEGSVRTPACAPPIAWESEFLYFTVREPWPSKTTSATLTFGKIQAGQPLVVRSLMPENGVIFSDGMEQDYLQFNTGTTASICTAERRGFLVQ